MPPKAVRGGRGRGQGRGRGRGRGKATASAAGPAPETSDEKTVKEEEEEEEARLLAGAPQQLYAGAVSTPQLSEAGDDTFSPNSSPATVPTETPAPTPGGAASSTLSLASANATLQPEPDAPAATGGGLSTRGGRGGARGGPKAPSKFKPKAVRTDASKLAELARKEQERLAGIAATRAREEAKLLRGRGRPARGRGDVMGRSAGRGGGSGGSGLFGAMPESIKKASTGFLRPGGGGGGNSASGIRTESGPSRSGGYSGGGGGGGGGGSEDEDVPRVDIETINLVSDDDDVQWLGTTRVRKNGMRPVRLDRHEHKARATIVNAGPAVKAEDEEVKVDEKRSSRPAVKNGAIGDPGDEIQVKTEPNLAISFRNTSPEPCRKVEPISPQSERKVKEQAADIPLAMDIDKDAVIPEAVAEEKEVKLMSKKRENKPVLQTEEDRAEYERHLEDIAILTDELGGMQGNFGDTAKAKDLEGDILLDDGSAKPEDNRSGRLYLFQFPPILPELYNPLKNKPTDLDPKVVKEETVDEEGDVEITGTGPSSKGTGKLKDRIDLIGESATIKMEEEPITLDKVKEEEEKYRRKRTPYVQEEGWIGKLVVRQSGRVELSWGGVNLLVGRGVDAGFLTTGIVVDSLEKGPPGGGAPEGRAMSMGQIMGKFVVTPDIENMV
ncbi:DNA-directed RNA polymerase III RPC4 [Diplocarpon rosae]|nr:DNA-directed RNA polymerase III RPC4 [Diplocarpon rosae]